MRKDIRPLPSFEVLHARLSYAPETGALTRKAVFNGRWRVDEAVGTVSSRGYLRVAVAGRYYWAHRIIWKMMTGNDPPEFVDHRDGDKLNNRWANLREADNGQNLMNSKLRKDNRSGVKGVCWERTHRSWKAAIRVDGKIINLGRFKSLEDAARIRAEAAQKHYGEFARLT